MLNNIQGGQLCQIWLVVDYVVTTGSILTIIEISIDRYWSINSPFLYRLNQSKSRALKIISFIWLISFLWTIPIIGKRIVLKFFF